MNPNNLITDKYMYVYIPREKIMNSKERKHRNNKFRKIYFYKNKKKYAFNNSKIQEIDIINKQEVQNDVLYKHIYKSKKDKYFDWYCILKPEYANEKEIFIEKNNVKPRVSYQKNFYEQKKKYYNTHDENIIEKLTIRF